MQQSYRRQPRPPTLKEPTTKAPQPTLKAENQSKQTNQNPQKPRQTNQHSPKIAPNDDTTTSDSAAFITLPKETQEHNKFDSKKNTKNHIEIDTKNRSKLNNCNFPIQHYDPGGYS
jgi:hypothetical protein